MDDLDYYWAVERIAHDLEQQAKNLAGTAEGLRNRCLRDLGVEHVSREPGFACWKDALGGIVGYFNTPHQVLEERRKRREMTRQASGGA
jgi:hypothetical protein